MDTLKTKYPSKMSPFESYLKKYATGSLPDAYCFFCGKGIYSPFFSFVPISGSIDVWPVCEKHAGFCPGLVMM